MGGQPDVKPTRAQLAKAASSSVDLGAGGKDSHQLGSPYKRTVLPCGAGGGGGGGQGAKSPRPLKRQHHQQEADPSLWQASASGPSRASAFVAEKLCKRKRSCLSPRKNSHNASLETHENKPFQPPPPSRPRSSTPSPPPHLNPTPPPPQLDPPLPPPQLDHAWISASLAEPTQLTLEISPCSETGPGPEPLPPPPINSLLHKTAPLGLKLNKTPSLLDFFAARLEAAGGSGGPLLRSASLAAAAHNAPWQQQSTPGAAAGSEEDARDKMKASNFGALRVKIGTWKRVSMYDGDLVAKCYYAKRKLVWEVLEGGLKSKMEVQWADISCLRTQLEPGLPAVLEIELLRSPVFFRETNPQPRKHTVWQSTTDFTFGEATKCRVHVLEFAEGMLNRPLEKLLMCDPRLKALVRPLSSPTRSLSSNGPSPWSPPPKHQAPASSPSKRPRKGTTASPKAQGSSHTSPRDDTWTAGVKIRRAGIPPHDLSSPISVMVDPRVCDPESASSDSDELLGFDRQKSSLSLHPRRTPQPYSPTKSTLRSHNTPPHPPPSTHHPHPHLHPHKTPSHDHSFHHNKNRNTRPSSPSYNYHTEAHNAYALLPTRPTHHKVGAVKPEPEPNLYHPFGSYPPAPLPLPFPIRSPAGRDFHSPSPPPRPFDAVSTVLGYSTELLASEVSYEDEDPEPLLSGFRRGKPRPFIDSPPGSPMFGYLSPPSSPFREILPPPPLPLRGEEGGEHRGLTSKKLCSIPKVDSSGNLLMNLPRIASMPTFLSQL